MLVPGLIHAKYCPIGAAVLEKNVFKHFLIYHHVKVYAPNAGPYMNLRTAF